ncbi:MAG: hypothetical protein ACREWG_01010 [Gammaproteobacteria bacterium]
MGYVPEQPKLSDTETVTPSYVEVKTWAYDVIDGYDSRATLNRQSIYMGAFAAAAAVGAVAGLAAFGSTSDALVGIPIGATFLGSVMSYYSSEEKARIYRLASDYLKGLVTMSDRRLLQCQNAKRGAEPLEDAEAAVTTAEAATDREAAKKAEIETSLADAKAALRESESDEVGASRNTLPALRKGIQALEDDLQGATKELLAAQATHVEAMEDFNQVKKCFSGADTKQAEEALCLRDDVNEVMRRVEAHVAALDPRNVDIALKAINRSDTGNSGSGSPQSDSSTATEIRGMKDGEATAPLLLAIDFSDLEMPVKSVCGHF